MLCLHETLINISIVLHYIFYCENAFTSGKHLSCKHLSCKHGIMTFKLYVIWCDIINKMILLYLMTYISNLQFNCTKQAIILLQFLSHFMDLSFNIEHGKIKNKSFLRILSVYNPTVEDNEIDGYGFYLNPFSPNSRLKTNFSFQFIASYVWYSMEKLAGDLLLGLKFV